MNDDPQLTIFEPLKKPRTVRLKNLNEDSNIDSVVIVDENGRAITDYKILCDELQSAVGTDREKILAYIENWELQNNANVSADKRARKIEKRKRKKERDKQRKAADMKSLIHCDLDRSALTNTKDVEEERAILKAMKMQNHSIKNVLNVKKNRNRFINLNTNVRPLENSTIEPGRRKTPIDVVVLDSEEESESDDDTIQMNIVPPPRIQRRNCVTDFSNDGSFGNQNTFVTSDSNKRTRRNKNVEIVQIVDSSDSDVECIPCEEFIESLSDDDDDLADSSASKKPEDSTSVPMDEKAIEELSSWADSFVTKYIQSSMPPLTEVISQTNCESAAPQLVITEFVSLQPTSLSSSITSKESTNAASKSAPEEPVSLQTSVSSHKSKMASQNVTTQPTASLTSTKPKDNRKKRVAFNNAPCDGVVNNEELVIVEPALPKNESMETDAVDESLLSDPYESSESNLENDRNLSEDSNEIEVVSADEDDRSSNMMEFDSIPSPDYTPNVSIPATASNMKALADFIRRRQIENSSEKDESEDDDSVESQVTTSPLTEHSCKSANQNQTPPRRDPSACEPQSRPWLKRCDGKSDKIAQVEHATCRSRPSQPWLNRRRNESDKIEAIEPPSVLCNQPESVDSDSRKETNADARNSFTARSQPKRPFQKSESTPGMADIASNSHSRSVANTFRNNSACVEFFDKNAIRIGESANKPEKVRYTAEERAVEPVDAARKFAEDGRHRQSNDSYQGDSRRSSGNQRPFYPPANLQCDKMSQYEEEKQWQYEAQPETAVRNVQASKCDNCCETSTRRPQQYCETVRDQSRLPASNIIPFKRNRYHPEPYEECKHRPEVGRGDEFQRTGVERFNRNRYHPEAYEEEKYNPESSAPSKFEQQRRIPWRNHNQNNRTFRRGRFQNDNHYHNRPPVRYNENNSFNQGANFQHRFQSNRGQQSSRFQRYNTQSGPRFGQQREERQQSYCNPQRSFGENNRYQNQPQNTSYSSISYDTCTRNTQLVNDEVLFTRRRPDKYHYKANISHFEDLNQQQIPPPPPARRNSSYPDKNGNSYQSNDVEDYESNVVQKLNSSASDENTFLWENNQSFDFVPFNANQPVSSSPPWVVHDDCTSELDPHIKAISRRQWISGSINSKI